jgi:hypothetical protein
MTDTDVRDLLARTWRSCTLVATESFVANRT